MPRYHFISGSTLLAAILRQNPRFHAGMSSPVGSLFTDLLNQVSAGSEWGPLVNTEQRRRLLSGFFDNYYAEQVGKAVVFDTSRLWCVVIALRQYLNVNDQNVLTKEWVEH